MFFQIFDQDDSYITLAMARDHMRISDTANDDALQRALDAAVVQIEKQTAVFLRSCTIYQWVRGDPNGTRLFGSPFVETGLLVYPKSSSTPVSGSAYEIDMTAATPRILTNTPGAFDSKTYYSIRYSCGYTSLSGSGNPIPPDLITATLELAGLHFENREAATPVQLYALPHSIRSILATYHSGAV